MSTFTLSRSPRTSGTGERRAKAGMFVAADTFDRPWQGDGLFGPDSFAWTLHSHPAILVGAARASLVQLLYPPVAAGVGAYSDYAGDLGGRTSRTLEFGYATAYGDRPVIERAREVFGRVHAHVQGTEPLTGQPYSAMDVEHRRYVAVTAGHSIMVAYQALGGRVTPAQADAYFAELGRAAWTSHMEPSDLPATREEVRDYLHSMRPTLALTDASRRLIRVLMTPRLEGAPSALQPLGMALSAYGAALMPRHLQRLAGIDRNPLVDRYLVTPGVGTMLRALARGPVDAWLEPLVPEGARLRRWAMRHAEGRAADVRSLHAA